MICSTLQWRGESEGSEQPGSPGNIIFNKESVLDRRPATKELISTFQKCSTMFHIQWLLSECGAEFISHISLFCFFNLLRKATQVTPVCASTFKSSHNSVLISFELKSAHKCHAHSNAALFFFFFLSE